MLLCLVLLFHRQRQTETYKDCILHRPTDSYLGETMTLSVRNINIYLTLEKNMGRLSGAFLWLLDTAPLAYFDVQMVLLVTVVVSDVVKDLRSKDKELRLRVVNCKACKLVLKDP